MADIGAMLAASGAPTGRIGSLIGDTWGDYQRFLHPAFRVQNSVVTPVTWRQVADDSGRRMDPRTACWEDASGYHLHSPGPSHAFHLEPKPGPYAPVIIEVLDGLTDGRADDLVRVAEWIGYGDTDPGRELYGAEPMGFLDSVGDSYAVWRTTAANARGLISGLTDLVAGSSSVFANYVWDEGGRWVICSHFDLASTYCGTDQPVETWAPELEWATVTADVGPC